jgi:beta-glucanase (GH16 family)
MRPFAPLLLIFIAPLLVAQKPDANWVLTFADEFNGKDLDLARWAPHDPFGQVRDRQLQAYSLEALEIAGGQLHIAATRHTVPVRYDGKDREYVSGVISTFGIFAQTYGRFEVRCRIPRGKGLRPGFLLLPVPLGPLPEIEVFQSVGNSPSRVYFANRWGTEQTERSFGDSFNGPDLSVGFHTLAIEWDSDKIVWFIDGKEKFRSVDGVPHQPMYLLLDLAVGGNLAKSPDSSTALPALFDIDYVRVYQVTEKVK